MQSARSAAVAAYDYVDSEAALREAIAWTARADRVAIDTEADSLHHYYEKVCLMQMTAAGRNFIVDPLTGLDVRPLLDVLADKTLILHGADYDLRMLRDSLEFRLRGRLIDTMVAAQLAGEEKIGLASQIEQRFGQAMSKAGQKSDWSQRPLTDAQRRYAVDDTRFLAPLADALLGELEVKGRRAWFEESCEAVKDATAAEGDDEPLERWRIRGVRDLTPRQAAFVRELWQWREREAQEADRPPFKIIGNEALMALALWAEAHPRARLEAGPQLPRHFRRRRLESLRKTILATADLGPDDWPSPRAPRREREPGPGRSFERLREAVASVAGELQLPPSMLAPRAALEEISRARPGDTAGIQQAGNLLRWQAELVAPAILGVLTRHGRHKGHKG